MKGLMNSKSLPTINNQTNASEIPPIKVKEKTNISQEVPDLPQVNIKGAGTRVTNPKAVPVQKTQKPIANKVRKINMEMLSNFLKLRAAKKKALKKKKAKND